MAVINSQRLNWALAFSALFGLGTAVTTVIPSNFPSLLCHPIRLHIDSRCPDPVCAIIPIRHRGDLEYISTSLGRYNWDHNIYSSLQQQIYRRTAKKRCQCPFWHQRQSKYHFGGFEGFKLWRTASGCS